jgi:ankyrin repeat protein
VRNRIVVAVALGIILAASTYAQTTDFFELVKTGTPQSVQVAIDQGAGVNTRDKYGTTALMLAAAFNQNPEVITALLKTGADFKAENKSGWTALMYAADENQNPEVITTLLRAGADTKAKDIYGNTAFDYAQKNEKLKGTDAYRALRDAQ